MPYYNKNGEELKLDSMIFLNNGCCADVFYDKSIIFKRYYAQTEAVNRIDEGVFELLKDIHNSHLIKLIDMYSDFDLDEFHQYSRGKIDFRIDGYTARYYKENNINILMENKDYLLDNINELELLFQLLSENYIYTDDLKRENTILGKNEIVIIDPDYFSINMDFSKSFISLWNKIKLLELLRNIMKGFIDNKSKDHVRLINDLFDIPLNYNTSLASDVSKKLSYVKRPVELFKK